MKLASVYSHSLVSQTRRVMVGFFGGILVRSVAITLALLKNNSLCGGASSSRSVTKSWIRFFENGADILSTQLLQYDHVLPHLVDIHQRLCGCPECIKLTTNEIDFACQISEELSFTEAFSFPALDSIYAVHMLKVTQSSE